MKPFNTLLAVCALYAPAFAQETKQNKTDDQWVIYGSQKNGYQNLFVKNIVTKEEIQLTDFKTEIYLPTLSNSKDRLLVEAHLAEGNPDVYLFHSPVDYQRLTKHEAWDAYPHWNNTDSKIVFTSARDGFAGLYVMDLNGNNQKSITPSDEDAYFGRWSLDGRSIMYHRRLKKGHEYPLDIVIQHLETGKIENLTDWPGTEKYATWSSDGQHIVFEADKTGNGDLYIMDMETREVQQLTETDAKERHPAFSSKANQVVHILDFGDYNEVFITDVKSKTQTQITFDQTDVWHPYFLSDQAYQSLKKHWGF